MSKKNNSSKDKEMSEGQAIAVTVLLIALGLTASVFAIQYIIGYFFPNLF